MYCEHLIIAIATMEPAVGWPDSLALRWLMLGMGGGGMLIARYAFRCEWGMSILAGFITLGIAGGMFAD